MENVAPFASIAIPLSLESVTGSKYKTISCVECGNEFVERNDDQLFRLGGDWPERARVSVDGTIPAACGRCTQKYSITMSLTKQMTRSTVPLHMQPQTLFVAVEATKRLRDVHCMECGRKFFSFSDRVRMVSDNTIPTELLNPEKLGQMEAWCKSHNCKQRWAIMT